MKFTITSFCILIITLTCDFAFALNKAANNDALENNQNNNNQQEINNQVTRRNQHDGKPKTNADALIKIGDAVKSVGTDGMDESAEATLATGLGWMLVAAGKLFVAKNDDDYGCWKEIVLDSEITEEEKEIFRYGLPLEWLKKHSNYEFVFDGSDALCCRRVSDGELFEIRDVKVIEDKRHYLHVTSPRRRITQ